MDNLPVFQAASFKEEIRVELPSQYWTGVEKVLESRIPKGYSFLAGVSAYTEGTFFFASLSF